MSQGIIQKYRNLIEVLQFSMRQRRLDFQVGDQPFLDDDSSTTFVQMIENSSSYLEYGSGGSTVLAAKLNKPFVSVDTDRYFLKAVHRKIGRLAPNQHLEHGNIGWTKAWGCPVIETPHFFNRKRWKAYPEIPWRFVKKGLLPDLVMVDGRFRVASALTSCVHLVDAPNSRILVDDYIMRPYYHPIADYAQLVDIKGRMAISSLQQRTLRISRKQLSDIRLIGASRLMPSKFAHTLNWNPLAYCFWLGPRRLTPMVNAAWLPLYDRGRKFPSFPDKFDRNGATKRP